MRMAQSMVDEKTSPDFVGAMFIGVGVSVLAQVHGEQFAIDTLKKTLAKLQQTSNPLRRFGRRLLGARIVDAAR